MTTIDRPTSALGVEAQFLADQVSRATHGAVDLSPQELALEDPTRAEMRDYMPIDPTTPSRGSEPVSLPPDVAARLGLPAHATVAQVIAAVKRLGIRDSVMSDPILERLRSQDMKTKVNMLHALGRMPDVRPEVITELERLLDDRTCAQLYIPYRYGELRVLAAEALAVARAKLGDLRPVVLADVPRLLSSDQMEPFREQAGIPGVGGPGPLERYQRLRDGGHLRVLEQRFDPATYREH